MAKWYSWPAESVWRWEKLSLRGEEMSGHQICYSEVSNGTFTSRAGGNSPLHISPPSLAPAALPLLLLVLVPSSALLSHHCPSASLCPFLMPLPPSSLPFPVSPSLTFLLWVLLHCLPHTWTWGLYFWHTNGKTPFFFTRNQFTIDYKYRIRAHYSTKHTSSGCFPAHKNTNFQWIINTCMKVTAPCWESNTDLPYIIFSCPQYIALCEKI